jgi:hypothetical protein
MHRADKQAPCCVASRREKAPSPVQAADHHGVLLMRVRVPMTVRVAARVIGWWRACCCAGDFFTFPAFRSCWIALKLNYLKSLL